MHLRSAPVLLRWLCVLLLGLTGCKSAAPVAPATPATEAPPFAPTPGLFLYEVRGKTGHGHLLGTMHVGFGFDEVLTPDARRRFEASTRVMTEADVAATNTEQLIREALLPPERSLRALLGEGTWQALVERIGAQLPAPLLDRLKPWLPAVTLGLKDLEEQLQATKPGSQSRMMDVEIMKQASALSKPVTHFETVADQIAVFDTISLEDQVRELQHALERADSAQAKQLLDAFAAGDEEALTHALFDEAGLESARTFYDRVLFQRNARWLPIIEREIEKGGSFIAVGAGHLLGERGLLAELERRGYRVRRVGR